MHNAAGFPRDGTAIEGMPRYRPGTVATKRMRRKP
jgi:hypothetical protein